MRPVIDNDKLPAGGRFATPTHIFEPEHSSADPRYILEQIAVSK